MRRKAGRQRTRQSRTGERGHESGARAVDLLRHLAELIRKAYELGFHISAGELYRRPEQQALYVRNGRSTTMSSPHLKRLAVDLNFFRPAQDGQLKLSYEHEEVRPLGEFWQGPDAANRWGGNRSRFKDVPHFERRERASHGTPAVAAPAAVPGAGTPVPFAAPASRRLPWACTTRMGAMTWRR